MKTTFTLCFIFTFFFGVKNSFSQDICSAVLAPTNRVVNGSFESGTTGWSVTDGATSTDGYYAVCGGQAGIFNPSTWGVMGSIWQEITGITPGTPLTFQGLVGTHDAGLACTPKMVLSFYNSSRTLISSFQTAITTTVDIAPYKPGLHSVSAIVPAGTVYTKVELATSCDWLKIDALTLAVNNALLPLKLVSFTGENNTTKNTLKWITESEVNVSRFDVETSVDGTSFAPVTTIQASTTTQLRNTYSFVHTVNNTAKQYYRLKMIDNNGAYTYSNIIVMSNKPQSAVSVTTFPNPFTSSVAVQWNSTTAQNATVVLRTTTGNTIKSIERKVSMGLNTITMNDLTALPAGIYLVEVWSGGVKIATQKIIK